MQIFHGPSDLNAILSFQWIVDVEKDLNDAEAHFMPVVQQKGLADMEIM